jgi:hypothetical protein
MNIETAPVLFLDFDGVTHPQVCEVASLFQSLPLIEAVLRTHPDVLVILSTSWREIHTIEELRERFSSDIASRVVGATPVINFYDRVWYPVPLSEWPRQREIEAWLHQNRTLNHPWVAIDDRPWWFESECPNLLVTSALTGFTESDADRLEDLILRRCS